MSFQRKQIELDGVIRHELLGYIQTDGEYTGNLHSHPFAETIYLMRGTVRLEYGERCHSIQCGEAVILRSGIMHRVIGEKNALLLYIGCSYLRTGVLLSFPQSPIHLVTDDLILLQLRQIAVQYVQGQYNDMESACELLSPLNAYWRRLAVIANTTEGGDVLIERVKEYLYRHPNEQICVAEIAEKFYISPHYLGNKFHKSVGMTIKQYHAALRMKQALTLIETSSLSLSQIAEQLGFNTLQYFSTCFKVHYGISPMEIKRR